jgi:hypothetical protein
VVALQKPGESFRLALRPASRAPFAPESMSACLKIRGSRGNEAYSSQPARWFAEEI